MIKPLTAINKWTETYDIDDTDWQEIFMLPYTICNETDLQSFQYKIINRFLPCNYTLSIWYNNILETCQYCHNNIDTLVHYFVHCQDVTVFRKQFEKMWKRIYECWFPI